MKLYYFPYACSLAPLIVAQEASIPLELVKVDTKASPYQAAGADYTALNPKGYVPAVALDDGSLLTEAAVILQYLGDLKPQASLLPQPSDAKRIRLQEWLNFIATELHKMFSPWLFHPEYGALAQDGARAKIRDRFALLEKHLGTSPYLMGESYSVADAYLFTIASWSGPAKIDLKPYPHLSRYLGTIAARPAVRAALAAHV